VNQGNEGKSDRSGKPDSIIPKKISLMARVPEDKVAGKWLCNYETNEIICLFLVIIESFFLVVA